jgi:hypothetical protein
VEVDKIWFLDRGKLLELRLMLSALVECSKSSSLLLFLILKCPCACVAVKWYEQREGELQDGTAQAGHACYCTASQHNDGAGAGNAGHHIYSSKHAPTVPQGRPHTGVRRLRQSGPNAVTSVRE